MPADPRAKERVGSVLHDKWTLESLIGEGGMGAVYAARHRNGARAAVKVLSPEGGRVPHIRKRFLHEGYAANRVDHPGAVKVLDDDVIQDGPDEGTAYLVMELLDGESLQARATRDPPLGERDLLELASEVLAVLEAAHAHGVVHRDLKPDNLFLAKDSEQSGTQIKVLDFGLARLLEAAEQTIQGMAIGTATYMSPEQAAGHVGEIDGRTDIYALGSILFQLRSNQRIHDAGHTLGLVIRMATTPAPKLRTVAPDASDPFASIVDRALEFRREDRAYLSAAVMRADVKAALDVLREAGSTASTLNVLATAATKLAVADTVPGTQDVTKATKPTKPEEAAIAAPAGEEAPEGAALPAKEPRRERGHDEKKKRRVAEKKRRAGLPMGSFAVVAIVTLGLLGAWRNWSSIRGLLSSSSASPPVSAWDDAEAPAVDLTSTDLDATTSDDDAAIDDEDASSADGGDDDEEDDDDDLDASIDAPAGPSAANGGPGPQRVSKPNRPPRKKTTPQRPGRRKRRWHW